MNQEEKDAKFPNSKFHHGFIRFGTHDRLEFPYTDDLVNKIEEVLKSYLVDHKIPFDPKDVRIVINVINQPR